MENTPEAAPQNAGTEATNTNTNPAPAETPAEPDKAPDLQGFTSEQLTEMKKFMDANGGYDKAFKTFKERISNPAPEMSKDQTGQQTAQQPVQLQTDVNAQAKAPQTPAGYVSPKEFMAQQYYSALASQEQYAPIADKIRSGELFGEMAKFGIRPMDEQGNINDTQVREFFDLYAKTVPVAPAKTPESSQAPTVDYIPTNQGKIDNAQQAMRIIAQSAGLKAKGLAEHPDNQAALDFLKNAWKK